MPNYTVQIPSLNNIQFVPLDEVLPERYHYYQMDKAWFKEQILYFQKQVTYRQPIQQTDWQTIQLHRTFANGFDLYVYNCNGEQVFYQAGLAVNAAVTGHEADGEQLWTGQEIFRFEDLTLPDGVYWILLNAKFYDGEMVVEQINYISEPLQVKEDHPRTVYLEYFYNKNIEDVFFQPPTWKSPRFGFRCEGQIEDFEPDSQDVAFKEQNYDQRQIASTPWRKRTLCLGGDGKGMKGIPAYMIDKANQILSCDAVFIEGRRYVKDEGAKWEVERVGGSKNYPLYKAEITVREYDPKDAITTRRNTIEVAEIPAYPFWYREIYMVNGGVAIQIANHVKIENDTDRDNLIDDLNGQNFLGDFSVQSGFIVYANAESENYKATNLTIVLSERLEIEVTTTASNQTFQLGLRNGAGLIEYSESDYQDHGGAFSSTTIQTYSHTFGAAATNTVYLWHNDLINYVQTNGALYTSSVTDIPSGDLPAQCEIFSFVRCDFSGLGTTGLDLSFIARAKEYIKEIGLSESKLDALDGTVFLDNKKLPTNQNWVNLTHLLMGNIGGAFSNTFSVAEVNSVIIDFYENTPKFQTGVINLRMNPAATPTFTALGYATILSNAGWAIVY